jgi:hypothetical protein
MAPRDIAPGSEWGAAIIGGIDACKIMVLIFSANANESAQVRREVERAISKGMTILPCRVEDVRPNGAMEYALSNTHWLDAFTPPVERQMSILAESVQALLAKHRGQAPPEPALDPPEPAKFKPSNNAERLRQAVLRDWLSQLDGLARPTFWESWSMKLSILLVSLVLILLFAWVAIDRGEKPAYVLIWGVLFALPSFFFIFGIGLHRERRLGQLISTIIATYPGEVESWGGEAVLRNPVAVKELISMLEAKR